MSLLARLRRLERLPLVCTCGVEVVHDPETARPGETRVCRACAEGHLNEFLTAAVYAITSSRELRPLDAKALDVRVRRTLDRLERAGRARRQQVAGQNERTGER